VRLTTQSKHFSVYDQVLPSSSFGIFSNWFFKKELKVDAPGWTKGSDVLRYSLKLGKFASNWDLDSTDIERTIFKDIQYVVHAVEKDMKEDFSELNASIHSFPRKSRSEWEIGKIVYYFCSPKWHEGMGGLLQLVSPPEEGLLTGMNPEQMASAVSIGHWVSPIPNRLVVVSNLCVRKINRIDPDAGSNTLCFFAVT
jgi:hypothetical protein